METALKAYPIIVTVLPRTPSATSTMADFTNLAESEFWKKKLCKAFESCDVTKSSYVSRADFELILDRHKKRDTTTPESLERLSKS